MISREPTLERLATAQQLMLEPFGLNEATLSQALALIGEHRVDDADLYFQTTRHEGWSMSCCAVARRSRVGSREIMVGAFQWQNPWQSLG